MKKLLILENSITIQKLFTKAVDKKACSLQFEQDGNKIFSALSDNSPDLLLINCDISEPKSFEIVKIIRSLDSFNNVAVGMYSNSDNLLDERFAKECSADFFFRLNPETLEQDLQEFAEKDFSGAKKAAKSAKKTETKSKVIKDSLLLSNTMELLTQSSYKNVILSELIQLFDHIEELDVVIKLYLELLSQICEVPLVALFITENDGPHGYYICSEKLNKKDVEDFLNVCTSDYEKSQNNGNTVKLKAKKLETNVSLDCFYNPEVKFSSYEYRLLQKQDNVLGTVHLVLQGNFITEKSELFDYCAQKSVEVFNKALIAEKMIFFEKRIRRAFSRFVPEQVIDNLVMQADKTDEKVAVGETRSVAILFSDIRSFTNISEKNRPDVLVAFLNRYFSTMVEIIKKHGGTIDKFIGDAIMAEFGTPVSYDDNCKRAVMAAYEMREALSSIEMGDLVMPDGMVFNIGIGIHYGDVIVGSIGSKDKTDYSVIGDSVNLASRLEGLTKTYGTQIIVSDSVRSDAGEDSFCFRHLDDVRVKGKKNAVPIYAVDRNETEFSAEYKDAYTKGMDLYKQGIWNLAKDYFTVANNAAEGDKACKLMLERCDEFIKNPPENWDGAIAFMTK